MKQDQALVNDGVTSQRQQDSVAAVITPELAAFLRQCFEVLVSKGEEDDVWSEYIAGPLPAVKTIPSQRQSASNPGPLPNVETVHALSRLGSSYAKREFANSGRGNADEDHK